MSKTRLLVITELAMFIGCLAVVKYAVLQGQQHPKESLASYAWSVLVAVAMIVAIEGIGYLRKQGGSREQSE